MNWREQRLGLIDRRTRGYERDLRDLVRAVEDVRFADPGRGFIFIPKGTLLPKDHRAVERRPAAFERLDDRSIERRVQAFARRLRSSWNVG